MMRYNLFDSDRLVSATTAYGLVMFALLVVGIGSAGPLSTRISLLLGVDSTSIHLALAVGVAGLLVPLQRPVRRLVDRLFFKDRFAFREGIGQLLRDLSACDSRGGLLMCAGKALVELLHPETCVVYERTGSEYVPAFVGRGNGHPALSSADHETPRSFAAETPLVAALSKQRGPLARERWTGGRLDTELSAFDRATLDTLGATVIVPVQQPTGLAAFVCIGAKRSGDLYTSTELALLAVVAEKLCSELDRFDDATKQVLLSNGDAPAATPVPREDAAASSVRTESTGPEHVAAAGVQPITPVSPASAMSRPATGVGPFVGREREVVALRAALAEARAGHGRLVLVTGEPGVGKSWLAEELAHEARHLGAHVAWGRCYEGAGAPPFFAWAQILRSCLRAAADESLQPLVSAAAANLVHVVPALRDRVPDLPAPTPEGPETRLRFFDSVARLLEGLGESIPLVVILDDLHAADRPSLLLFEFLAHQLRQMRLLLVATCRDTNAASGDLAEILAEVAREPGTGRIELKGFTVAEVANLLEAYTGVPPKGELPEALHRRTGGSPLFVSEFVRMLDAEKRLHEASDTAHASLGIPSTVRTVIRQRLAAVTEPCREVLKIAAVAGHVFSIDLLLASLSSTRDAAARSLDEAVTAGILIETKEAAGRYRFAHVVMRDTLYDGLPAAEKAELHRRVGDGIVQGTSDDALAEISHHFLEASTIGEPDAILVGKAIDYTQRAAQRAVAVLAYEEGARLYRLAIAAVDRGGDSDPRRRAALWLGLGEALFRAGDVPLARQAFGEAAALARKLSDPETFARAVVGSAGRYIEVGVVDAQLCELLEEALLRLPEADSCLRARLLARLAAELAYSKRPERAAELCDLAVDMARRMRDPAALSDAFNASQVASGALRDPQERLALAGEIIQMAEATADSESVVEMLGWRVDYLLEVGEMRAVDAEIARHARLAERLRQPLYLWLSNMFRAMRALHDGRFDAAEQLAAEAAAHGQRAQNPNAMQAHAAQMFFIRREQGRLGEWRLPLETMATEYADMPAWRVGLAYLYADTGYLLEAKALFDQLAEDDFGALPQDRAWLMGMALLSEVAAAVHDAERSATLYALLLPFEGRNVSLTGGAVSVGAVSRYLGLLAMTMGREDDAERHLEAALTMHARMAAGPNIAHTQADLAALLLRRGRAGDRARLADLLQQACARAEELGMVKLLEKVVPAMGELRQRDRDQDSAAAAHGRENGRVAIEECVFRKEGDYWTIAFEGRTWRLKDLKGLYYLAQLLQQPGHEFHALDLVQGLAAAGEGGAAKRQLATSNQLPVLDAEAKAAYRRRLKELDEELSDAEAMNDLGRTERAQTEMDSIADQFAGAVGLGGRDRPVGSDAERARQTVTKSIRTALDRIRTSSPALALHLTTHVKTGYFCSYLPDPQRPISWVM